MTNTTGIAGQMKTILADLERLIGERLDEYFNDPENFGDLSISRLDDLFGDLSIVIEKKKLSSGELFVFLVALTPHVLPNFFDDIIRAKIPQAGDFPQFGGVRGKQSRGVLPTGETILFLLAGYNYERRFEVHELFGVDHFFSEKRILWLEEPPEGEPRMSGKIVLSYECIELVTTGRIGRPRFSMTFPAQLLRTKMEWEDLVLNEQTLSQVQELETWIQHGNTLLNDWGMDKRLKPGYRALFHGPPGTGKTLTATLLGKYTEKDVYKIDLSMVVSKFIGETEKNLANLFAKAENKDWILFFDEADALFGKRTNVRDAHDKYANQEVSYLLQRVEDYNGLVILASNFKSNIDDAFLRRFQCVVHFPMPRASERLKIWQKAFPAKTRLSEGVKLSEIARTFELSGAGIMNVVQYACLQALKKGTTTISNDYLAQGIEKEYEKEGRIL